MSYKVGDKVKIVNCEKLKKIPDVMTPMHEYENEIATIKSVKTYIDYKGFEKFFYSIDLDGGTWQWYEECFVPIKQRGFEVVSDKFRKHPSVDIQLPQRGSSKSAGYDICTPVKIIIPPNGVSDVIQTDLKAYMQDDEVLQIYPRSSLGFKKGIMLINTTGIIDSDFYNSSETEGNIGFKLKNLTDKEVVIEAGERIMQGIFQKYLITDNDNCNTERIGGIGSTGR